MRAVVGIALMCVRGHVGTWMQQCNDVKGARARASLELRLWSLTEMEKRRNLTSCVKRAIFYKNARSKPQKGSLPSISAVCFIAGAKNRSKARLVFGKTLPKYTLSPS